LTDFVWIFQVAHTTAWYHNCRAQPAGDNKEEEEEEQQQEQEEEQEESEREPEDDEEFGDDFDQQDDGIFCEPDISNDDTRRIYQTTLRLSNYLPEDLVKTIWPPLVEKKIVTELPEPIPYTRHSICQHCESAFCAHQRYDLIYFPIKSRMMEGKSMQVGMTLDGIDHLLWLCASFFSLSLSLSLLMIFSYHHRIHHFKAPKRLRDCF
jgi:hypothetical protein